MLNYFAFKHDLMKRLLPLFLSILLSATAHSQFAPKLNSYKADTIKPNGTVFSTPLRESWITQDRLGGDWWVRTDSCGTSPGHGRKIFEHWDANKNQTCIFKLSGDFTILDLNCIKDTLIFCGYTKTDIFRGGNMILDKTTADGLSLMFVMRVDKFGNIIRTDYINRILKATNFYNHARLAVNPDNNDVYISYKIFKSLNYAYVSKLLKDSLVPLYELENFTIPPDIDISSNRILITIVSPSATNLKINGQSTSLFNAFNTLVLLSDLQGNKIWMKFLPSRQFYLPANRLGKNDDVYVVINPDTTLLMEGRLVNNPFLLPLPVVLKYEANGKLQWIYQVQNPANDTGTATFFSRPVVMSDKNQVRFLMNQKGNIHWGNGVIGKFARASATQTFSGYVDLTEDGKIAGCQMITYNTPGNASNPLQLVYKGNGRSLLTATIRKSNGVYFENDTIRDRRQGINLLMELGESKFLSANKLKTQNRYSVFAHQGNLHWKNATNGISVYNMTGKLCYTDKSADGNAFLNLNSGYYIIKTNAGKGQLIYWSNEH